MLPFHWKLGPLAVTPNDLFTVLGAVLGALIIRRRLLALGTNICNMAIVGVFAGYLPYFLWGRSSSKAPSFKVRRSAAIFAGGVLSVLVSATLALSQLLISGVPMPRRNRR